MLLHLGAFSLKQSPTSAVSNPPTTHLSLLKLYIWKLLPLIENSNGLKMAWDMTSHFALFLWRSMNVQQVAARPQLTATHS